MKVCIYGAGAIGAYLGAALADGGAAVTLIARGRHLEAIRERGLVLEIGGVARTLDLPCTDDAASVGLQDYVVLAVKSHAVAPATAEIEKLLGAETAVVTAQNGIPWWYFHALPGPWENQRLAAVDPEGAIWRTLGPERAIGCVVYPSCEIVRPGVVRHHEGNRFMLGEPSGAESPRVVALAAVMAAGGLKAPVRKTIRNDIWFKLLGNATFNPVSVLTRATLGEMGNHAGVRALVRELMSETERVATALGVTLPMDIDKRLGGATAVGDHKTSMLQDYEQGRPLELDALVAAVAEIGRLVGVPTPMLDAVLALVRLKLEREARLAGAH